MKRRPAARWVGIDEAGYGPNLGPMVMTAVVAESWEDRPPDIWADLASQVCRARGNPDLLWIDDSKAIHKAGQGRDRLEAASLALLRTLNQVLPESIESLFQAFGAGTIAETELDLWHEGELWRPPAVSPSLPVCEAWRIVDVKTIVIGPAAFNLGLACEGANKASVHFSAFQRLLRHVWNLSTDGVPTNLQSDKHGGRHFYHPGLIATFPDARIDRGVESPALSRYSVRFEERRLELGFKPRADADDGLVALASIVSKTLRELWMDHFNDYWSRRIPGIKRTAGYPVDASRFRAQIESEAIRIGLNLSTWWRLR